jgi:hypothetical protein
MSPLYLFLKGRFDLLMKKSKVKQLIKDQGHHHIFYKVTNNQDHHPIPRYANFSRARGRG